MDIFKVFAKAFIKPSAMMLMIHTYYATNLNDPMNPPSKKASLTVNTKKCYNVTWLWIFFSVYFLLKKGGLLLAVASLLDGF